MINNAKIMTFVATKDPAHAKNFYEQTLGLKLAGDDPFALVFDAQGTMLRIQKVKEFNPAPFTVLGWEVADINAEVDGLAGRGVEFARYEWLPQDERGIWTTPDGARVAWFKDPDGNVLSLTQF